MFPFFEINIHYYVFGVSGVSDDFPFFVTLGICIWQIIQLYLHEQGWLPLATAGLGPMTCNGYHCKPVIGSL